MNWIAKNLGKIAVIGGGAVSLLQASMFTVDGGERAIIFNQVTGVQNHVVAPGTHFLIPILQRPIIYDVRTTPRHIKSETGSKDLQTVNITLRVLFKPDITKLPKIFSEYGIDYDERILPSLGNEVLKSVVAQYDASELITQRELVSREIQDALNKRTSDFNIVLQDVSITHLSFSQEFTNAIEHKQVAQQEAERSKFIVLKNEQEKKAAIIRAEGEAEAAKLIGQALQGPGFIELRKLEASREMAETLSKSRNISYIPDGNVLLSLNTSKSQSQS